MNSSLRKKSLGYPLTEQKRKKQIESTFLPSFKPIQMMQYFCKEYSKTNHSNRNLRMTEESKRGSSKHSNTLLKNMISNMQTSLRKHGNGRNNQTKQIQTNKNSLQIDLRERVKTNSAEKITAFLQKNSLQQHSNCNQFIEKKRCRKKKHLKTAPNEIQLVTARNNMICESTPKQRDKALLFCQRKQYQHSSNNNRDGDINDRKRCYFKNAYQQDHPFLGSDLKVQTKHKTDKNASEKQVLGSLFNEFENFVNYEHNHQQTLLSPLKNRELVREIKEKMCRAKELKKKNMEDLRHRYIVQKCFKAYSNSNEKLQAESRNTKKKSLQDYHMIRQRIFPTQENRLELKNNLNKKNIDD